MRAPLLVALFVGGCTVERAVPLDRFACSSGGPCDGSIAPIEDGHQKDADPEDATTLDGSDPDLDALPEDVSDAGEPMDAGPPLAACPKIVPLPRNGLTTGDNTGELNSYEPTCSQLGGPDVVFGFDIPGRLVELRISTNGSTYDTVLHFYRDDCTAANAITCSDDYQYDAFGLTSFIRLESVEPGRYAVIVDANGPDSTGSYILKVEGKIAPGETCDPTQTFLACEIGTCATDGQGGFRCPEVKDCPDGIDADDDGIVDEDSCTDPPLVSCSPASNPYVNYSVDLVATVSDQGGISYRQWKVTERPVGAVSDPFEPNREATYIFNDIQGRYRVRYRAADDLLQISACEVTYTTIVDDYLRVELIWNTDRRLHERYSYLDLHLLHPNAQRWFDPALDCVGGTCSAPPLDWGQQGNDIDDPFLFGFGTGPQWVTVYEPQLNGTYGVGVAYDWSAYETSAEVVVNIFCYGDLVRSLGPVTLTHGDLLLEDNDFWKVAEVDMNSGGCQVTPYQSGGNPLIVTGREAETAR